MPKFHNMKEKYSESIPSPLRDQIILMGLQGSRGLGMAQKHDADYDYRGVWVAPLKNLVGLSKPKETTEFGDYGDNEAEFVFHELGKFLRLCMKGNPSVIQILFVPKYNVKTEVGAQIVHNKNLLLSTKAIRNSFGGYALSQAKRLARSGNFAHGRKRSKHIRHIFRLFDQGQELLETGNITLPLKDPQKYIDMGEIKSDTKILEMFEERDKEFQACKSVLPEKPHTYLINEMLVKIRLQSRESNIN